jgi:pyruvate formate lyase activating enzyme
MPSSVPSPSTKPAADKPWCDLLTAQDAENAAQSLALDADEQGYVHSVESCGTVDGPGIRFIAYLQGCPLRCQYCHNPDTRAARQGEPVSVESLIKKIRPYRNYFKASGGGVTISGGEPLLQPRFAAQLLKRCKEEGFHTALDTSGYAHISAAAPALEHTDLVLLDLKSYDAATHRHVTGVAPERIRAFAEHLAAIGKPVWVRFVLVPGLTDHPDNIEGVARIAASLGNVERVDVLPFHQMGAYKWERLGLNYTLQDTPPATIEQVNAALDIFRSRGLRAC